MDKFVKLRIHDSLRNESVDRWFNIAYIRHIEPETNKVMLNGAKVPIIVSTESMEQLMAAVANDNALQKVPFMLDNHIRDISVSEVSKLSMKVAVLHQALINFSVMLRGSGERVAMLEQLGDETDDLIDMVYRDICNKIQPKESESNEGNSSFCDKLKNLL